MLKQGATIIAANPNMPWPGAAAVVISLVFIAKSNQWHGRYILSEIEVETISAFLSAQEEWSPKVLRQNENHAFIGCVVLGLGYTLSEQDAKAFFRKNPKYKDIIYPYINGDDLNSSPSQKPSRWIINFFDWPLDRMATGRWLTASDKEKKAYLSTGSVPIDYPSVVAADFPDILEIIRKKVKPQRDQVKRTVYRLHWWQYAEKVPGLYHAIGRGSKFVKHPAFWKHDVKLDFVLVNARVCKYFTPSLIPNDAVFHEKIVVMINNNYYDLAFMNSSIIQDWVWTKSSTLGTGLNFSPSDSYETLPFPDYEMSKLQRTGVALDQIRKTIMTQHEYGLTALYNDFHNQANDSKVILEMRKIQKDIDCITCQLYGWDDIPLEHGFHKVSYLASNDNIRYTISEPARIEILRRLAKLNHQRWQEEQEE